MSQTRKIGLICMLFEVFVAAAIAEEVNQQSTATGSSHWHNFLEHTANTRTNISADGVVESKLHFRPLKPMMNWILGTNADEPVVVPAQLPCQWPGNVVCTTQYSPICVTNLRCIFVVRNQCTLDKLNCGCVSHYTLASKFCSDFTDPFFKRCNVKIFIN